jgi:hypothetical protein
MDVQHPSYDDFARHAHRFGVECVFETAAGYLTDRELRDLDLELALIAGPRRRRHDTSYDPTEHVLALAARGMVVAAIADALGIGDRRVKSILKCRTGENGLSNPHHQRAESAERANSDGLDGGVRRRGRDALSASQEQLAFDVSEALTT